MNELSASRNEPAGAVAAVAALALLGQLGCASSLPGDPAIQRASREFSCPPAKIGIIQRSDIAEGLFDLDYLWSVEPEGGYGTPPPKRRSCILR